MYSLPNRRALRVLAFSLLLAGASAAMADILVVRSVGPSAKNYPLGKRLPDNARIVLQANDQLTLLDGRGTREIRGPGSFIAASASSAPAQLASNATVNGRRARIGAVRGIEGPPPRTIWDIDASRSGNVCISPPSKVNLWRADPAAAATLTVTGAGKTRQLAWAAGDATLNWPDDLPLSDGAEYRLSWRGAGAPTTIRFRTLPQHPAGLDATASMLITNQCQAQLDLLIDTVRVSG
ncbi:MAG TPA: hypothetical protein VH331_07670 [Allosphingosinicella sp.]|nr:hypothetical protein [Allosphingosinicella sp.]